APLAVESGTLNSIVWRLVVEQWPAVRKLWLQWSISLVVPPIGSARAWRGSLERTRSSVVPHCVRREGGLTPAVTLARTTRQGPLEGSARISTWTSSPLKYALVLRHWRQCSARSSCRAPSSTDVMTRVA